MNKETIQIEHNRKQNFYLFFFFFLYTRCLDIHPTTQKVIKQGASKQTKIVVEHGVEKNTFRQFNTGCFRQTGPRVNGKNFEKNKNIAIQK